MSKRPTDGSPKVWRTIREMREGIADVARWMDWERNSLELFHAYAHRFGGSPGSDVFLFVLRDALKQQGKTLEQFKREVFDETAY